MYPIITQKVFSEAWLITAAAHEAIQQTLINHIKNPAQANIFDAAEDLNANETTKSSNTFIVSLHGIIGKHLSGLEMACGGCSLDAFAEDLKEGARLAKEAGGNVLVDINSPGGTVTGVPETAHLIRELKAGVDIFAFTDSMMGSAAMWIGSACTNIISTPSASVGSIGAYMAFIDQSARMEKEGDKLLLFEAGLHKAIGLRPPTEDEMKMLQDNVDAIHTEFKESILMERPDVLDSTMQGLVYKGIEAEALGLVDALVMSFDEALKAIS